MIHYKNKMKKGKEEDKSEPRSSNPSEPLAQPSSDFVEKYCLCDSNSRMERMNMSNSSESRGDRGKYNYIFSQIL